MTPEIKSLVSGMRDLASGRATCHHCGEPTTTLGITMFGCNFTVLLNDEDDNEKEEIPTLLLDALNKNALVQ
jgi:hypothetical protein